MQGMMMHKHTQEALHNNELAQMSFLLKYLEDKWSIKKRNDAYILKQSNGSKMTCTSSYLDACLNPCLKSHENIEIKQIQLLTFLHNALDDGWNIKKHLRDPHKYVFMKTHNGHCEIYEDDEYLTRFIKGNLRLQS
jgi:hypothetical protein